jgi:exosortase/archaeosortase family protein
MNSRYGLLLGLFSAIVILTYREEVLGALLGPVTAMTANTTFLILHLLKMNVVQEGTIIYQPGGFAYEIYYRCTGFLPVAGLAICILAHSGKIREKLIGLSIGIPFLILLNFVRLVHLFIVGVIKPTYFDFAHNIIWNTIIILVVLGFWLTWKSRIDAVILEKDHISVSKPERI